MTHDEAVIAARAERDAMRKAIELEQQLIMDEMLYGQSFKIGGERIDPTRIRIERHGQQVRYVID